MKRTSLFTVLLFLGISLFPLKLKADWTLSNFDIVTNPYEANFSEITVPWVSPVTGRPWVPNYQSDVAGFYGYEYGFSDQGWELTDWNIINNYTQGDPNDPNTWHHYEEGNFGSLLAYFYGTLHHTGEDWVPNNYASILNSNVYAINNGRVVFAGKPDGVNAAGYVVVILHKAPRNESGNISPIQAASFNSQGSYIEANHYSAEPGKDHNGHFKNGEQATNSVYHEFDCNNGNILKHETSSTVYSYYLHLGTIDSSITVGAPVFKGQIIGQQFEGYDENSNSYYYIDDNTQEAVTSLYSAHLHFEIWRDLWKPNFDQKKVSDQAGYANPGSDFENTPLVHPQCFFQLNNKGMYLGKAATPEGAPSSNLNLYGNDFSSLDFNQSKWTLFSLKKLDNNNYQTDFKQDYGLIASSPQLDPTDGWYYVPFAVQGTGGATASPKKWMQAKGYFYSEIELVNNNNEKMPHSYWYPFFDVKPFDFFGPAVARLWANDVIGGFNSGDERFYSNYGPWHGVNRAQFVKLLIKAIESTQGVDLTGSVGDACNTLANYYADIQYGDTHWYCPYFLAAIQYKNDNPDFNLNENERSVIRGIQEGNNYYLKPGDPVTRAQAVKMLVNASKLKVNSNFLNDPDYQYTDIDLFNDININDWYAPFLASALKENYFTGYDAQTFRPHKILTRGEAATILGRAWDVLEAL